MEQSILHAPGPVGWTEAKTIRLADEADPFVLESGRRLWPVDVEYETYGELSEAGDNAVLITHGLSGDAHVAGLDSAAEASGRLWRMGKPGWWDQMVGPGRAVDTRSWFAMCANFLGSCYGTTGPSSTDPFTGRPYGLRFPEVTVGDWVELQARLMVALGIGRIHTVMGGSLGGQQAIEWALRYPDRVEKCIVMAAAPRLSAQGLAFNSVGRHCILSDPDFRGGDYYGGPHPSAGLAAARMLAHITYLSDDGMHESFGRRLREGEERGRFGAEYEVESYLHHQGKKFVERFDANSYLYITRAMDRYDAAERWGGGDLAAACARIESDVMIISFSSDWLYTPEQSREFAEALCRGGRPVTYVNIPSQYGHDAFLVETEKTEGLVRDFIEGGEAGCDG